MARQQERERQDQERQQRSQYVPPALREAFADMLPDEATLQPEKPDQRQKTEKKHRWMPSNDSPIF
ncbi:hypothetical protein SAMN04487951_12613 [Vreelandella arcis]|uniref:Uncharacterized protein n=1 Tax=Vreelandella arcis TaxID=416873 RepID=A0A1H0JE92_9GAMM|nr:hypothetical protein SAMN04487951_12613 [Halomonas arcis]